MKPFLPNWIVRGSICLTAVFIGPFIGSEGRAIMTPGRNIVLFAILILGLSFLFRLYCLHFTKKSSRLLLLMYILISFFISVFFYLLRLNLVAFVGLALSGVFSSMVVFNVVSGEGQTPPLPGPSGTSSSMSSFPQEAIWQSLEPRSQDHDSWRSFPSLSSIQKLPESPEESETHTVDQPQRRPSPPFNPVAERGEASSSVPNEGGHEATSKPTGVMEQAGQPAENNPLRKEVERELHRVLQRFEPSALQGAKFLRLLNRLHLENASDELLMIIKNRILELEINRPRNREKAIRILEDFIQNFPKE